jgi:hypothetical protein
MAIATATHDGDRDLSMLGAMRLRPSLVAIIACVGLAACGGSSHTSTTPTSATSAAQTSTSTTQAATTTQAAATTSAAAATTTTTSTSAPPEVPKAKKQKHHGATHAASQGAHVETNVVVSASGDVSPPVVSVPSGVGVEIHVSNHGTGAATVTLSVPTHPSVHVAPGASGTLETAGLKDGTYRILVNGTPRGQIIAGAQGGP